MTSDFHQGSAKIYQFPTRVRSPAGSNRDDTKRASNVTSLVPSLPLRVANASFGDAWYHEEAMREAELPRKN